MCRSSRLVAIVVGSWVLGVGTGAAAQDLVIANARILDGAGLSIDAGYIVVENGRIAAVAAGAPPAAGGTLVDAQGLTVLPGFIDAHRHIMRGDDETWFREQAAVRMREFLEAGFTTLMSGGGPVPGILELERRIEAGELEGPRIVTSGRADPGSFHTVEQARAQVRALAAAGVQIVKASVTPEQKEMLAVIVDEARQAGLDVMVHAVTVPAMIAAIEAGAAKLVHTPHDSFMTNEQAKRVADAGIENLSTVGFAVPVFGVFNDDNVPTFRDGSPWPAGILGTGSNAAGEKAVNARTLWDNGVVYGFGTDTDYLPREGLKHELRALNLMFSPQDILKLMGPNTAAFIERDDLGTIAPGKIADLVIVDGDPLDLIFDLLNVEVVIKGGEVVVDRRAASTQPASRAADEAAIRGVIRAFIDTREGNDADALTALLTADADQRVTSGNVRAGRGAVVSGSLETTRRTGGRREIAVDSLRFLGDDVAIADGRYDSIGRADGTDQRMLTSIVLRREAGAWKIAAIRNMIPTAP